MSSPDFSQPDYWNAHYEQDNTPWDFGGAPAMLKLYLRMRPNGGRVLIPGCGSGHEIRLFAEAGYEVTAMDFAPAAVARARAAAGPELADRVILGDFFTYDFPSGAFDVVYERTFLCALDPGRREVYRDRVARLIPHGGSLIGFFYYKDPAAETGPPYGFAWGESDALFGRHFLLIKDLPVPDSLPFFAGRERWQEQRRTAYSA